MIEGKSSKKSASVQKKNKAVKIPLSFLVTNMYENPVGFLVFPYCELIIDDGKVSYSIDSKSYEKVVGGTFKKNNPEECVLSYLYYILKDYETDIRKYGMLYISVPYNQHLLIGTSYLSRSHLKTFFEKVSVKSSVYFYKQLQDWRESSKDEKRILESPYNYSIFNSLSKYNFDFGVKDIKEMNNTNFDSSVFISCNKYEYLEELERLREKKRSAIEDDCTDFIINTSKFLPWVYEERMTDSEPRILSSRHYDISKKFKD